MPVLRQITLTFGETLDTAIYEWDADNWAGRAKLRSFLGFGVHSCYALLMNPAAQSWLQVAVLLVGIGASIVGAVVYQTHYIDKRIEALDKRIEGLDKRIDDLRSEMGRRFDELIRYVEARFKAIEDRLERLEHPVTRP